MSSDYLFWKESFIEYAVCIEYAVKKQFRQMIQISINICKIYELDISYVRFRLTENIYEGIIIQFMLNFMNT